MHLATHPVKSFAVPQIISRMVYRGFSVVLPVPVRFGKVNNQEVMLVDMFSFLYF
jgi:hypothetical protein